MGSEATPSAATDRLTIVFVSHGGERSGAPIVLTRMFEQALKEGEEAFLVFRYNEEWAEACQKKYGSKRVYILPGKPPRLLPNGVKPLRKLFDLLRLWSLFKRIKPQVVVANTLLNTTAVMAGLLVGSRVAVWAHESPGAISDPWGMRSFWIKRAHLGLGVSQGICSYLQEMGMDPSKIRLLHHGVDVEKERSKSALRPRIGGSHPKRLVLGALAVWSPRKRLDLVLETAYALARSGYFEDIRLDIGGPPDALHPRLFQETLDRFPKRLEPLTLRFMGTIVDRDSFYRELDALLMTSDKEALPTVVLEALVREIPVFSFKHLAGVQEIMGEAALQAEERKGAALADAILRFFLAPTFPRDWEEWVKKARARISLFSLDRQWHTLKGYLREGA
jgi:glycosyltransferase involved in cell wall biosynthesis